MVNNCLEDGQLILEWAVKVCALTLKKSTSDELLYTKMKY